MEFLLKTIDSNELELVKDSLLVHAISSKSYECFIYLLENGYQCKKTSDSDSLLSICARNDFILGVRYLVEKKGEIVSAKAFSDALDLPYEKKETIIYLLDKITNEELNKKVEKYTIVHWLCSRGDVEIAKIVLSRGIDVNSISDNEMCFRMSQIN